MINISNINNTTAAETLLEWKLKMLELLDKLDIKYRNILEDFNLFDIVKNWSWRGVGVTSDSGTILAQSLNAKVNEMIAKWNILEILVTKPKILWTSIDKSYIPHFSATFSEEQLKEFYTFTGSGEEKEKLKRSFIKINKTKRNNKLLRKFTKKSAVFLK